MSRLSKFVIGTFLTSGAFAANATLIDFVTLDGKDWIEPSQITGLAWNQVNAVCPVVGMCSGTLSNYDLNGTPINSIDVTGWTWASASDVGTLFSFLTAATFPGGIASLFTGNLDALNNIVGAPGSVFLPTMVNTDGNAVVAWSSTTRSPNLAYQPYAMNRFPSYNDDRIVTSYYVSQSVASRDVGVWLYRTSVVSEPATFALLGLGLAGLGFSRRKKA